MQRIHERHAQVRRIDRERDAGQPRPRANVDERVRRAKERRVVRRQTVDDVLDRNVLGRGERREVDVCIPLDEHFIVAGKLRDLFRCQHNPRHSGTLLQDVRKRSH